MTITPTLTIFGSAVQTLYRISHAASKNPTQPTLACVLLEPFNGGLNAVATDGYVIAASHLDKSMIGSDEWLENPKVILIPPALFKLMKPSHFNGRTLCMIELTENDNEQSWSLLTGGKKRGFTCTAIEGKFPSWQKIMTSAATLDKMKRQPQGFALRVHEVATKVLSEDIRYPVSLNEAMSVNDGKRELGGVVRDGIYLAALPEVVSNDNENETRTAIRECLEALGVLPTAKKGVKS